MSAEATRLILQVNAPEDCLRRIDPVLSHDGLEFGIAETFTEGVLSISKFRCNAAYKTEGGQVVSGTSPDKKQILPQCAKCKLCKIEKDFNAHGEILMIG